jgi:hypothetical protein
VRMFKDRNDIADTDKRQIAWNNPQTFYGFRADS